MTHGTTAKGNGAAPREGDGEDGDALTDLANLLVPSTIGSEVRSARGDDAAGLRWGRCTHHELRVDGGGGSSHCSNEGC